MDEVSEELLQSQFLLRPDSRLRALPTKAIWPDGHSSRSLIVGFEDQPYRGAPRQVKNLGANSINEIQ